ncbi:MULTISPECIES: DUF397 domain-containing protein [Streptomyces]|uniref:DUF397 domain-containing protein n=1 Tax=Streptomyces TaxID=1883 RepID=UPI0004BD0D4D|nr:MULTISPECIES: DUF397 domain-containing protein [Streptomyces]QHF97659.1 DUF397 domain-containing protein [Streptomyces sp. NHF165]
MYGGHPELKHATWRKASHSNAQGGNCVEVAWRKSSYSNADGGNCVEVAIPVEADVFVRDSKVEGGPTPGFSRAAWGTFLAELKR